VKPDGSSELIVQKRFDKRTDKGLENRLELLHVSLLLELVSRNALTARNECLRKSSDKSDNWFLRPLKDDRVRFDGARKKTQFGASML
jgi:hypothetical protein